MFLFNMKNRQLAKFKVKQEHPMEQNFVGCKFEGLQKGRKLFPI